MPSNRKQEYTEMDENFLPRLNEELREVWLKLDQLDQGKALLVGPNRVAGAGRRTALVKYSGSIPLSGSAVSTETVRVPLDGRYCLDGAPHFQKADWVSAFELLVTNIALSGFYKSHSFEIVSLNEEAVTLDITRDYTGGTVPAWTVIILFAVSGVVGRV